MLPSDFLGGVVEGFYGRPWSLQQRLELLDDMAALGLNAYLYAPKNDLKHRAIWREPYDDEELASFRELAAGCDPLHVQLIYGMSPGLDIRFSEDGEQSAIRARFSQLRSVGVRNFALLFDDLPGAMDEFDCAAYESLAAAQCDLTNDVFAWLLEQSPRARLLFCPTPYCDRMDRAHHGGVGYLDDVGRLLDPAIDVLWTGPEIVSREIPVDSIERLTRRLRRRPVIWDNLFANDYDVRRLYCGPYSGRPQELRNAVRGILINPNNEFPINFIPLRTTAEFLIGQREWKPREAFLRAVSQWLPRYETVARPIALEDLQLLADCFYLPHEEGPSAESFLAVVRRLLVEPVATWGDLYEQFAATNSRIQALFDRLTELRDRELFDAWSRRAWELKEELLVIDAVLAQKRSGRDVDKGIALETCLPGTFRGGILATLQRLLEMNSLGMVRRRTTN